MKRVVDPRGKLLSPPIYMTRGQRGSVMSLHPPDPFQIPWIMRGTVVKGGVY